MKRIVAGLAVAAIGMLTALPATAETQTQWAVKGEARALELGIGGEGLTLGMSITDADSTPHVEGFAAGQCDLIGDDADASDLPCTEGTSQHSEYPGNSGNSAQTCAGSLPDPINQVVTLNLACGSSSSDWKNGGPTSKNTGKVGELGTKALLDNAILSEIFPTDPTDPADALVDAITDALDPVLTETPAEIQTALENILAVVTGATDVQAVKSDIGPSSSTVTSDNDTIVVDSQGAAARIGLVGLPVVDAGGLKIADADPLKNGLVIVEVGPSRATASLDKGDATAASAASAALVTVKIRDITSPTLKYVEVPVSPGQSVTVLEGTPLESTITAAVASTDKSKGTAVAAADAVRLELLKGIEGGIELGLSRTAAAVNVQSTTVVKPEGPQTDEPTTLPVTGGHLPYSGLGLLLLLGAAGAFTVRRRVTG